MGKRTLTYGLLTVAALTAAGAFVASRSFSAAETTVSSLTEQTHLHGLAVAADPSRLYLATHHGLYAVTGDGKVQRISATSDDLMGCTPHPSNPSMLFASDHPARGGNLGFIASSDCGKSWSKLADGVGGSVDFHQMAVSPTDPKVVYGAYAGRLQASRDGGQSWQEAGPAPQGLIGLAASSKDAGILYAATESGLLRSEDGGGTWQDAYWLRRPATMVHVTSEGEVFAFLAGIGLIATSEPSLTWRTVSDGFGERYILHLAAAGANLYAVTFDPQSRAQVLLASHDAGKTWSPLGTATNGGTEA